MLLLLLSLPMLSHSAPGLPELRNQALPLVKKYCTTCHQPFGQASEVERAASRILPRLDFSQPNAMPPPQSRERAELERNPADLRAMRDYLQAALREPPPVRPELPLTSIQLPKGFRI